MERHKTRGERSSYRFRVVFTTEDEKVALIKSRFVCSLSSSVSSFLKLLLRHEKKPLEPSTKKKKEKERSKTHRPFLHSGDLYSNLFFPFFHAPRRAQKKRRREDEKEETFCSCLCLRLRLLRREREREEKERGVFILLFFFSFSFLRWRRDV